MKRMKKLLLDHHRTFAKPPFEALTSAGPLPDVVAPLDHHLRPSPPPDHRLTPLDHHLRPSFPPDHRLTRCSAGPSLEALTSVGPPLDIVAPRDHHLRPSPPPDHRLTSLLCRTTT
ncbi:hypothetical protein MA16_Dca028850 [Dendrobium catenatum]|uniref:Uncharacterized protein n=1 Tax=Dendrobium catenatum TaxID=906689 RepID=A0A2I0VGL2_9ASPA|nr:hypothetical protein MA16_Dca028850 [Dendrobium catenatum]